MIFVSVLQLSWTQTMLGLILFENYQAWDMNLPDNSYLRLGGVSQASNRNSIQHTLVISSFAVFVKNYNIIDISETHKFASCSVLEYSIIGSLFAFILLNCYIFRTTHLIKLKVSNSFLMDCFGHYLRWPNIAFWPSENELK